MYEELVQALRSCVLGNPCELCPYYSPTGPTEKCSTMNVAAADAIEELSKPRWVSVEERLPENYKKVLVFWTSESEPMMDTAFWQEAEQRFNCEHWIGLSGKITHWMPLPEPPKEEA